MSRVPFLGERYRQMETTDEVSGWPLHQKIAGKIDLEKVSQAARKTSYAEAWERLMTAFDPTTYSRLRRNKPARCTLTAEDIQSFLRDGLFERIDKKDVMQWANLWALPEPKKRRRRIILWPSTINSLWRKIIKGFESHITDCLDHMDIEEFFIPLDMPAAFFQVEIPKELRKYFAVDTSIGPVCITRLPMGVSFAPELLQLILKIAIEADKPIDESAINISAVHIDNVLLSSTSEESVITATSRLQDTLKSWGGRIDIDEKAIISEHKGVFCGAEFNSKRHEYRVKQSSIEKIIHPTEVDTVGKHRENISRLLYASRILRIPMADYYFLQKWTRRMYSKIAKGEFTAEDTLPKMWQTAEEEYRSLFHRVKKNEWTSHPKKTALEGLTKTYLITDASLDGWGAVLVQPGRPPKVYSGVWPRRHEPKEMTTLEMRALRCTLKAARKRLTNVRNLSLVGDNTSMKAVLRKGSAFSYELNAELAKVIDVMPRDALIFASYLETSAMPADDPSRGRPLDATKLKAALKHLQLRQGPSGVPEGRTRDCVSRVRYAGACTTS